MPCRSDPVALLDLCSYRDQRNAPAAVVLRLYEGLSEPEIAGVLACPPGTVRSLEFRAMRSLRADLTLLRRAAGDRHEVGDLVVAILLAASGVAAGGRL